MNLLNKCLIKHVFFINRRKFSNISPQVYLIYDKNIRYKIRNFFNRDKI